MWRPVVRLREAAGFAAVLAVLAVLAGLAGFSGMLILLASGVQIQAAYYAAIADPCAAQPGESAPPGRHERFGLRPG